MDPISTEASLREMSGIEQTWGLPPIPESVKLDLATMGDPISVRSFLYGLGSQVTRAVNRYDKPSDSEPIGVMGGSPMTGALAQGITPASPMGMSLQRPPFVTADQVPTQEISMIDRWGQLGTGIMGASVIPGYQQYDTTFNMGQQMQYVKDPNAVMHLKKIGIEMGLLPKNTKVDGRWDPSMNSVLFQMAQEDFNRSMGGDKPGALSTTGMIRTMGDALSPEFAFNVVRETLMNFAKGFWWDPGDIREQHQENVRNYQDTMREGSNASIWEKMGALGKVVFGVADDIVMPIINWGLMFSGVGETFLTGKVLLGASKFAGAVGAGTGMKGASYIKALSASDEVQAAIKGTSSFNKIIRRGFDEAATISDMNRQIKAGKFATTMSEKGALAKWDPMGKVEAWRSMRGVMMGRKATQQMLKFSQANMLMSAAGENPADMVIEEARARQEEWYRENMPVATIVGILTDMTTSPRHVYRASNIVAPRAAAKTAEMRFLESQQELYQVAVKQGMAHAEASGDTARAAEIGVALKTHGPVQAYNFMLHGTVSGAEYSVAQRARASKQLWESAVVAGIELKADEIVSMMTMGRKTPLKPVERRDMWQRVHRKLLHQVQEWDPEDYPMFEQYLMALGEEARAAGNIKEANSLGKELDMWRSVSPAQQRREFAGWAITANDSRNMFFQQLLDPILQDSTKFQHYLDRTPRWLDAGAYDAHRAAMNEVNYWITGRAYGTMAGAGLDDAGQIMTQVPFDAASTRQGLSEVMASEENQMPHSLSEMLAPQADDATGLRKQVGLDPADEKRLDVAIEMVLDGRIPRSSLLGGRSMSNILNRSFSHPQVGSFAVARAETLTGNQAQLFIDQAHGVVDMLATLRRITADPQIATALGQRIGRAKKNLSKMDRSTFKSWVTARLGGRAALTQNIAAILDDPVATNQMRNLVGFLQQANVTLGDMKGVQRSLDRRVRSMMSSEGVWKELGVPDTYYGRNVKDVVKHSQAMLKEAKRFAATIAVDVPNAPIALKNRLAADGLKMVYGTDFIDFEAASSAMRLGEKLPGLRAHGDLGVAALSMFMPDKWAQKDLFRHMSEKAGRVAAMVMHQGERRMHPLHETVLKENLAHRLNELAQQHGIRLPGTAADQTFDMNSREVGEIYQGLWQVIQGHKYAQQSTANSLTGWSIPNRVAMAWTPQTLREADPGKIVKQLTFGGKLLFEDKANERLLKGIAKAMRDSIDLGSTGRIDEAMAVRGPLLWFEDFIRSYGTFRGLFLGLPMLAGSAMGKTIRNAASEVTGAQRALMAGGLAGGASALNESLGTLQGNPFNEENVLGSATAAALGGALGGRPMSTALGTLGGATLGGTESDGSYDPKWLGIGAAGGAALSDRRFRDMEAGIWKDGKTVEASGFGRMVGAAGGAAVAPGVNEEGDEPWGQAAGIAIGSVLGPMGRKLAPPMLRAPQAKTHFLQAVGDWGKFMDQTLTTKAFNATMALRFTLSPLFDLQRHMELATFSMVKELELPSGQIAKLPLSPMGQNRFIKAHGPKVWNEWATRFDNISRAVNHGHHIGFDAAETSVKYFMANGILGFNPTAKGVSIFKTLVDQGMDERRAYEASREILAYGVRGRTTGELTANAIFFPFSFQARYVGRWAKWLQNDVMRGALIAEGMRTYDALNERYDLNDFFEKHLPLVDQLKKINSLSMGMSLGEFGGIHRPWIDFFIPLATTAVKSVGESFSFWNPNDGIAAIGSGIAKAASENIVDGHGLVKRIIPMWRDVMYLVEDLKEQNHVVFSPKHMTAQAETTQAATKWRSLQDSADHVAQAMGYQDSAAYISTPGGAWLGNDLKQRKAALMDEYPVWGDVLEEIATKGTASRFTFRQIAENPQYPVDYQVREFINALDTMEARYQANGLAYDFSDPSTLPTAVQEQVRTAALRLAGMNQGFDRMWDKYFKSSWGPISRPLYLSMNPGGTKVDEEQVG